MPQIMFYLLGYLPVVAVAAVPVDLEMEDMDLRIMQV